MAGPAEGLCVLVLKILLRQHVGRARSELPHVGLRAAAVNNLWDRRINLYTPPTLEEITEGAFAPANKEYVGIMPPKTLRPKNLGWLSKDQGAIDPARRRLSLRHASKARRRRRRKREQALGHALQAAGPLRLRHAQEVRQVVFPRTAKSWRRQVMTGQFAWPERRESRHPAVPDAPWCCRPW